MVKLDKNILIYSRNLFLLAFLAFISSCATTEMAAPDTSLAESNIKQAATAGAQEYAPLALRNAREKLEQARKLVEQEKYKRAHWLTEEAAVDAQLALLKARSAQAKEAVKQLQKAIDTLKEEIENIEQ